MGTCGIAAGIRAVMDALVEELSQAQNLLESRRAL